jgi:hypothetical protein
MELTGETPVAESHIKTAPARPAWARTAVLIALLVVVCGAVARMAWQLSYSIGPTNGPETTSAAQVMPALSQPADSAPVIGVSAAGRHRAYLLQAFLRADRHVYNDLLGDVPVSVTYCDLDDCTKVFTGPAQDRPLDIAVGGADASRPRKMLLRAGSKLYWQDTRKALEGDPADSFPYTEIQFERTTWGQWRKAHPDTELYTGESVVRPTRDNGAAGSPQGKTKS